MDLTTVAYRLEIDDLLTRYTRAIDTGDWDRLDTVFTPDATLDYTATGGLAGGYDEVKAWLAENLPLFPRRQHVLGQKEALPPRPGAHGAWMAQQPPRRGAVLDQARPGHA